MKKILHIMTTEFTNYGIAHIVKNYVSRLKDKFHFDFLINHGINEENILFVKSLNGQIIELKNNRNSHPIKYMNELSRFLKENKYDIVHVHGNSATLFFDMHALKRAKVPMRIAHCHASDSSFKLIHYCLKPFVNSQKTVGLACSKQAGEWVFYKNFQVLNNAIITHKFAFSIDDRECGRKEFNIQDEFVLLCVGTLSESKNHQFILDILPKIIEKKRNIKLLIVGEGDCRKELENQIEKNHLEQYVTLVGARKDIEKFYSIADAFLFPSIKEGLGLVLVEAQACGLPCIASKGVPLETNITNSVTYIPLKNSTKWIETILDLAKMDNEVRIIESQKNIRLIKEKKYDIDENVRVLEEIYLS